MNPLGREILHVYLTDDGGTPLVHLSRRDASDKDPDLVASMFAAFQNFMDDSFHSMGIGSVKSIELGDRHQVAFGRGHKVLLYVVYHGRESNRLERRVIEMVGEIERDFSSLLEHWGGDLDRLAGLKEHLVRAWKVPARDSPFVPTTVAPPMETR